MLVQYKEMRNLIRWCEDKEDYAIGIVRCKEYLKIVLKDKTENTKDDIHFGYFVMAKLHKNLYGCKNLNITINYIKQSIKYSLENRNNYISSIWLLAECYVLSGNTKKALNTYRICKEHYNSINCKEYELYVHFNMAKISKCTYTMERLVNDYIKNFDIEQKMLDEMYTDIFNIYIENNKIKAFELLHKIQNKKLAKELSKRLLIA